jgi:hypothetical protein
LVADRAAWERRDAAAWNRDAVGHLDLSSDRRDAAGRCPDDLDSRDEPEDARKEHWDAGSLRLSPAPQGWRTSEGSVASGAAAWDLKSGAEESAHRA